MFALRIKGETELLGFSCSSNGDAEFCGDVSYELENSYDNVWVVKDRATAERAAVNSPKWYNANFETPENPFWKNGVLLEIVELTVKQ